ncbi:hypothetical protein CEUSTIGMA_g11656.t1 [Chlamydomonas eustigma]|uniref:Glycosyltransferase 2-like domain-containing protein n=1 Tax=Chlamydomonas eustigma TaxID=1157962 RepID=A0A250XMI2_9CHLO|nr:hypothetical protein CEUSTIGMA_g11656.t1 [Chlamydomonas eustigma]|eukprot:GAX84233.1 hypothetical protein CEUSTIGMA_g11656.t1 [Chlamydomonas eustigma]
MWIVLITLLLFDRRLDCHAQQPHNRSSSHVRQSLLPNCSAIEELLGPHNGGHIRDLIQLEGQAVRKYVYWEQLMQHLKNPPTAESERIAFTTSHTLQEVQEFLESSKTSKISAKAKVDSFISSIRSQLSGLQMYSLGVIRACSYGRLNTHLYEGRPRVSMLLQFYKRSHAIDGFIKWARECKRHSSMELLVNVDHPQDHEAWALASYNTSGLVIPVFSNNIHEIRSYNTLARLARGDILVLMQDDQMPRTDEGCKWMKDVVSLFDRWPDTGVIGLHKNVHCWHEEGYPGMFVDPETGIHAHWAQKVDLAPMAVRRTAMLQVGGFDETLSEPGMCGIISDWEFSQRMWISGWAVMGLGYKLEMDQDIRAGGTHVNGTEFKCWGLQMRTAGEVMSIHNALDVENEMCDAARYLNLKHLRLVDSSRCPYKKAGCTLT